MHKLNDHHQIIIIISSNAEWRAIRGLFSDEICQRTPYGEWFMGKLRKKNGDLASDLLFFHGGWGKIAAAASTQYAIDRWKPKVLINLGTCGGFMGKVERGIIILADKTLIYDIDERMGDFDAAIAHYTCNIDLSWIGKSYPIPVLKTLLVSADRDLRPDEIERLFNQYEAIAGDWESGAIAWIAQKNDIPILILRGVTDLVSDEQGEAYGKPTLYHRASEQVIHQLVYSLPGWLDCLET